MCHFLNIFYFFTLLEDVYIDRDAYVGYINSTNIHMCMLHRLAPSYAIYALVYGLRNDLYLYLKREHMFYELIELRSQQNISRIDNSSNKNAANHLYFYIYIFRDLLYVMTTSELQNRLWMLEGRTYAKIYCYHTCTQSLFCNSEKRVRKLFR